MTLVASLAGALLLVVLVAGAVVVGVLRRRLVAVARALDAEPGLAGRGLVGALAQVERAAERAVTTRATTEQRRGQLLAALDQLPHAVVVADADGRVVFRNAAARMTPASRHATALVEDAVGGVLHSAVGGTAVRRTLELFGPPRRTLIISGAPFEPATRIGGALVLVEDVTERTRLEAVRTDFVANISHELRTPVGAIAVLAETLLGEDDPAVSARLAERMLFEAHRVGHTIEDLLQLSRIELGEGPPMVPVPVAALVDEAVERLRPAAELRQVCVAVAPIAEDLVVLGDQLQLVSALSNLLENAVKYSDPGSAVEVAAAEHDGEVELSVRDHGIGIPAPDLERIFERFYRVDRARSRDTGGTGLGLAIVRHVATNHQGEVTVHSAEGEGSTFTLRLPVSATPSP